MKRRKELSEAELRWAAGKHRMGYGWAAIAKALARKLQSLCQQVKRSGYAYELPRPEPMPADCPDWVDYAWELYLDGHSALQAAMACGKSEAAAYKAFWERGYRKVMPPLVTAWIGGYHGQDD